MQVSLDNGLTWLDTTGCNVRVHYFDVGVENEHELHVNLTSEGMILDLVHQGSGYVDSTAALDVENLIDLTH
jgi:hypothetical protein